MEWTERGVQGAWRFAQRLWRLVGEAGEIAQGAPAGRPAGFAPAALKLRKATHRALAAVTADIEKLHFNVCVAHVYEFANTLNAVIGDMGSEMRPIWGRRRVPLRRPISGGPCAKRLTFLCNCSHR